ncbi:MAG: Diguanylate cyclase/phosphodiesterase [Pseudonocardiales bacterium]|nr:Diguanylate cyclase/phosphodiesterase [Pseudonocardiales bacterium]
MARRTTSSALRVLISVTVFLVLVRWHPGGDRVGRAVDDLGQLLAAVIACVATAWRARIASALASSSWRLLAFATGSWALGEVVWSYYELVSDHPSPFPSLADVGYLGFAVLAIVAMLVWPSSKLRGGSRWRALLDGVLIAGSLFILSWVTALGSVRSGGDGALAWSVSLSYPVSDLILITLAVVVVAHASAAAREGLGPLVAGLIFLCVADSGFAYLTSVGRYVTGSPVDAGWFGGFLLIAAAARTATAHQQHEAKEAAAAAVPELESTTWALLPYVPAALGLAVAVGGAFTGRGDQIALVAATLVMAALLLRQLLAVLDNRTLVTALVSTQQALHFQAFHDPLTGLANRALFNDRLRHGLELHRRDLRPLGLLYCDLDGFKSVNDTLGHEAGDQVIKIAAERLKAITRTADTVARMGGDEFAILLEHDSDTTIITARILEAFTQPAFVNGHDVPLGISIGIAELTAAATPIAAETFLHRADSAMYQAKRTGKGFAITWAETPQPATLSTGQPIGPLVPTTPTPLGQAGMRSAPPSRSGRP